MGAQSWKTDLYKDIRSYLKTKDETFAKDAMKRGYLTRNEEGGLKLTSSGEKFMSDVGKFLGAQYKN